MDLERMLRMCRKDQWKVGDLDFAQTPRPMTADDERAVVQYFTDMAQIERLAGALFVEQERRVEDPTLRAIYATFVGDELRHSHVAQMLADHYDRRRLEVYRPSVSLQRFFPHFIDAIRHLSDEIANAYITSGELMLDIALLRSIDDFVDDPLSKQAMALINRDESRHIAVDYYMVGYYISEEHLARRKKAPRPTIAEGARAAASFVSMTRWSRPFFRDVFFAPMARTDPSGTRMRAAFKRMQLLGSKPGLEELPILRFWQTLLDLYNHPRTGRRGKNLIAHLAGAEPAVLERIVSEEEISRAARMSFDELANDALSAKHDA